MNMRPDRRHWIDLAVQSAMIVFSVLLALAASSWADARKQQRLGDQALQAFAEEIRANRARLTTVLPYHDSLDAAARRLYAQRPKLCRLEARLPRLVRLRASRSHNGLVADRTRHRRAREHSI